MSLASSFISMFARDVKEQSVLTVGLTSLMSIRPVIIDKSIVFVRFVRKNHSSSVVISNSRPCSSTISAWFPSNGCLKSTRFRPNSIPGASRIFLSPADSDSFGTLIVTNLESSSGSWLLSLRKRAFTRSSIMSTRGSFQLDPRTTFRTSYTSLSFSSVSLT